MSRIFLSYLAVLTAAMTVLVLPAPVLAQVGVTGDPVAVCVKRARPGMTPRGLLGPGVSFDCRRDQRSFGAGDFWVRSALLHRSGASRLRQLSVWDRRSTVYAFYADGAMLAATIDQIGASRRLQLGGTLEQRLPARAAPLVRLLWHVEGSINLRGIVGDVRLATPEQSVRSNLTMGALYAAFAGLCVALFCYNLALWVALRYRFQLAYCVMVLALALYMLVSSGAIVWLWPQIGNSTRISLNYMMLGLSAVAGFGFARTFFEQRVFEGWLSRLLAVTCIVLATASVAFALFAKTDFWLFNRIYMLAFIAQMAVIVPIVWRALTTRSNYLWVFAIIWAATFATTFLRIASSFQLIRWNFWLDNSTLLMMTLEALLSSFAIAYRIRLLSVERDEAREREIAARLLADIDPLTGLLNRRAFLAQAIGRAGEQTLMIADIDHFKRVNDTIGHDGGDEVLRVFARTLRQSVPPEALIARIGGEEFAIVISAGCAVSPGDILARLRTGRMPYDVAVTASIGTCTGPLLRETDWKALYAAADRALFEAKSAGRDRARGRMLPERLAA